MAMVSMRREPEREEMPGQVEMDEPAYPEGLTLELEADDLEKLGITALPAVGTTMEIRARVYVKKAGKEQTHGGEESSVELQVTDLGIEQSQRQGEIATLLYGA